jgi:NTP pyrophosphatase (non-canonical NTP hydrolase)
MTQETYLQQSKRTAAVVEQLRPDLFRSDDDIAESLLPLIRYAQTADLIKRSFFYNEAPDRSMKRGDDYNKQNELMKSELLICRFTEEKNIKFTPEQIEYIHTALGLISEAGEIIEEVLNSAITQRPIDKVNMVEELGDVNWYVALGLRAAESTFEEAQTININKLKDRYPEKFSSEQALNRDLEKERKTLEKY